MLECIVKGLIIRVLILGQQNEATTWLGKARTLTPRHWRTCRCWKQLASQWFGLNGSNRGSQQQQLHGGVRDICGGLA